MSKVQTIMKKGKRDSLRNSREIFVALNCFEPLSKIFISRMFDHTNNDKNIRILPTSTRASALHLKNFTFFRCVKYFHIEETERNIHKNLPRIFEIKSWPSILINANQFA